MEQGGWIVTFGDTASICVQSLIKLNTVYFRVQKNADMRRRKSEKW